MATGRIHDFRQPNKATGMQTLSGTKRTGEVEVIDPRSKVEATPVEIRVHEEVIVHGQEPNRVRLRKDGNPDLRFRNAPSREEWEKVKRLEDK